MAPATGANAALLSRISAAPSVCVHFRVGHHDGTAKRTNRTLGTLPLEYYARALEQVASNAGALELFVFADDMAWAREQVRFAWPTTFVDVNDGRAAHEDLRLMSCCRHFIIANSALSWWAAWLSRSPRKIVCAPQRWFADGSRDTSDLIPEGWLRL